jgi:lipid-A-disaccharide synthase
MKYYIIAGETSGDLHGSHLVRELRAQDAGARFRGNGGDLMAAEGVEVVQHIRDLDFMGFMEILMNLRRILSYIRSCKEDVTSWKPDAVILIDYPGFNLRIAEYARKRGIKVFYYISPQLWAWKQGRIRKIRRYVDHLFVILPFEKEFYSKFNYHVDFVGHPLLDAMTVLPADNGKTFREQHGLDQRPIIALLPGSRKQEIRRILPVMLRVIPFFNHEYQFVIAGTTSVATGFYHRISRGAEVPVITGHTYSIMIHSRAALITSGTATLEAALLNLPQVVCYKANPVSYLIARKLVHLNFISLVNLILGREVVRELIQRDMNETATAFHLNEIIYNDEKREQIFADYVELRRKLGGEGASKTTAGLIVRYFKEA